MATYLERLATLEANQANGNLTSARTEANTKDILELVQKMDRRADQLESRVTKVETHFGWMKGIFATVQAGVLAWFGSK